jgi:hypothetical protein
MKDQCATSFIQKPFFGLSQFNLSPVTALAIPTIFVTADKHSLVGHYGVGVNSPGGDYGG